MEQYRWNAEQLACGYDSAAQHIHPYYEEIQAKILELIEHLGSDITVVDAGGGSGRFIEMFLSKFPLSRAVLVDQSKPFVHLSRKRLQRFGRRTICHVAKLQDDWFSLVDQPSAIVSMSAIHHLEPDEKRRFYEHSFSALADGGILVNGDEIRSKDDAAYLEQCKAWASHMHKVMDQGLVPESMCQALLDWEERNVGDFDGSRSSGDDCHETAEAQCRYLASAGFASVTVPWKKEMWAILEAVKAPNKQ